ncbi:hypothetical protein NJB1808e29_01370 [Mycobacterium marinum]|nr:hypothetical protein NJB1808e29_01370 [Mycobacterium marinum]GJP24514.1 hypothetical protein NJB1808_32240 [Mycobacterium marinum]
MSNSTDLGVRKVGGALGCPEPGQHALRRLCVAVTASEPLDSSPGVADGKPYRWRVGEHLLDPVSDRGGGVVHPYPTSRGIGDHDQWCPTAERRAERVGSLVKLAVVAVGLVGPNDGGGMGAIQEIAQLRLGAFPVDGGAAEDLFDDFAALGADFAGQRIVFQG